VIPDALARVARMGRAEIAWRTAAAARIAFDRTRAVIAAPKWDRRRLRSVLARTPELASVREALAYQRWDEAHRRLAAHFMQAPQRFVIAPSVRRTLVDRIGQAFPNSARDASARADRVLAGQYDLLGYTALRFGSPGAVPDWHLDPVHDCRPPKTFWATVPFLTRACGDHKIIWELNRHQHWLTLGRAFWLTGDHAYRDRFVAELASWIAANPPLTGINWASMLELGLRSISWLWALQFFVAVDGTPADRQGDGGPPKRFAKAEAGHHSLGEAAWLVDLLLALDRQLAHVERNLSFYFSPNTHLTGEALALYVVSRAIPELAASARREALGRRVLVREIERQIAADGGHREGSACYHRYTLDFYLLALAVARLTRDPAAAEFERAASRLAFALRLLADGQGRLPHIGDEDGGSLLPLAGRSPDDARDSLAIAASMLNRSDLQIGPTPEEVLWINPERGIHAPESSAHIPSAALPDMGYFISRSTNADHLVIDGGPHGYLNAGHAHADALSITFEYRGEPVLIDPGSGCYTFDPDVRDRLRSSALHNTLTVDGRSQSIPAGPFHWAHTANAHVRCWRTNAAFDYFDGVHDGYGAVTHRRRVLALHGSALVVADFVDATGTHRADAHWHIHPRWTVQVVGRRATLTACDRRSSASEQRRLTLLVPDGLLESFSGDEESGFGWYSPRYGRIDPATTLRVSHQADGPFWIASIFDLDPTDAIIDVDWLPVWAEAGAVAHASALRLARQASTDFVVFAEPNDGHKTLAWRIGELETDARMLFWRDESGRLAQLALVDGSIARGGGRRGLDLTLPRVVSDLHVDFPAASTALNASPSTALSAGPRIAGAAFGVRLIVEGREWSPEPERRSAPRIRSR
jgi:hypothetical protein